MLAGALFTWRGYATVPPRAPPEPISEEQPGPEQVQKEMPLPVTDLPKREPTPVIVPSRTSATASAPPAAEPGPPVKEATASESSPAPPAPQLASAKPTWEGQVLGALNKAKRYPREARSTRQQGVPYIRFVMDRDGKILSVRLERSSGVRSLARSGGVVVVQTRCPAAPTTR